MKRVLSIALLLAATSLVAEDLPQVRIWNSSAHDAALVEVEPLTAGAPIRIEAGQELVFTHTGGMVTLTAPPTVEGAWHAGDGIWTEAVRTDAAAGLLPRRRAVRFGRIETPTRVHIGDTASFTGSHRVSGVATIVGPNTIRVSNLRHDGSAPGLDLRIGLATQSRRSFVVLRVTGRQAFAGEIVDLVMPPGVDLNSFDTFTVWCYEFDVIIAESAFRRP